jgi:hypothetical protein
VPEYRILISIHFWIKYVAFRGGEINPLSFLNLIQMILLRPEQIKDHWTYLRRDLYIIYLIMLLLHQLSFWDHACFFHVHPAPVTM